MPRGVSEKNPPIKGQIVKEWIRKYPDMPRAELARKIYKNYKGVFENDEAVRSMIRYYTHNRGSANRKTLHDKSLAQPPRKSTYVSFGKIHRPIKRGVKGDIAKEYLKRFPSASYRSLSRMIFRDHPDKFKNSDQARDIIRHHTMKKGKKAAQLLKDKSFKQPKRDGGYRAPSSDAKKTDPYILPNGISKLGILSDIHFPYHDQEAVESAVNYLKEANVDALLLNGDTIDFYGLSNFEKDPRKRSFANEIKCFKEFLQGIKEVFDCPIYYKIGNHEYRYQRYMIQKAPELLDIPDFELSSILEFGAMGVNLIESTQKIKAGKFTIYHGHEFRGSGGVNPARWLSLKAKISAGVGHFHKASEHVWRDSNDQTMVCYSFGCLCELKPDYLPENEWTQGFALLHLDRNGDFHMENKKIINGKVY